MVEYIYGDPNDENSIQIFDTREYKQELEDDPDFQMMINTFKQQIKNFMCTKQLEELNLIKKNKQARYGD